MVEPVGFGDGRAIMYDVSKLHTCDLHGGMGCRRAQERLLFLPDTEAMLLFDFGTDTDVSLTASRACILAT